jgi:hypothetical protein
VRREVEAEGREARLRDAEQFAVEVNLRDLACGLELDENFFALPRAGRGEGFAVPRAAAPLDLLAAVAGRRPVVEGD